MLPVPSLGGEAFVELWKVTPVLVPADSLWSASLLLGSQNTLRQGGFSWKVVSLGGGQACPGGRD